MKRWRGRLLWIVVGLVVAAGLVYAFAPQPVAVDVAAVTRGPLRVTVDEEGQTRVRERYVVSAPLAGQLLRIPWDAGDPVAAGETVLAVIVPSDPALLDVRAVAEAEARVRSAEAALAQAQPNLERAQAQLALARSERERLEQLAQRGAATSRELNDAVLLERVRENEVEAAQQAQEVARFELELARAALLRTRPTDVGNGGLPARLEITSPHDGQVFRVLQKSAAIVTPGTPLIEVGDPADLEVIIDVLSRDAVRIQPGDEVWFEEWGGDAPLRGAVRTVEPAGFTKISALGVEEQRVNVIADIVDPPEQWRTLGDAYRVEARIVVWQADDVLKVPTSALFRQGGEWAVFVAEAGEAKLRRVRIGRQTAFEAEVLDGLTAGDRVIAYPSDEVAAGTPIVEP